MFPHCNLKENEVLDFIDSRTDADVQATLNKQQRGFSDLMTLLSPAAANHLDTMRTTAQGIKLRHFGKTVRLYAPLYISNYCVNDCEYCGFKMRNKFERKRLAIEEIVEEAKVIYSYGITSLLLVSGEDPRNINVEFLEELVPQLKSMFSYIGIEIAPMPEEDYKRLFDAGIHGLTLYQETYDRDKYSELHTFGPKSDYDNRLDFVEGGASAGFYNIGLGALLGLHNWRSEVVSLAAHGMYMKKKYWKTKIQFSFPRITEIAGGFKVPDEMTEAELEQVLLAFRIFFEEADLYISTRESREFRQKVVQTCASHMSAASVVVPGGYVRSKEEDEELNQFSLNDKRSVQCVADDIREIGLEPVFKDWDICLGA